MLVTHGAEVSDLHVVTMSSDRHDATETSVPGGPERSQTAANCDESQTDCHMRLVVGVVGGLVICSRRVVSVTVLGFTVSFVGPTSLQCLQNAEGSRVVWPRPPQRALSGLLSEKAQSKLCVKAASAARGRALSRLGGRFRGVADERRCANSRPSPRPPWLSV